MGSAILLREDYDGPSYRLLSLAEIYDCGRRLDGTRVGGVGLRIIGDRVLCFNAEGLHIPQPNRRSMRQSLEQTHRSAVEDHVYRAKKIDSWVLITTGWLSKIPVNTYV